MMCPDLLLVKFQLQGLQVISYSLTRPFLEGSQCKSHKIIQKVQLGW